jgi:hypothetical protein
MNQSSTDSDLSTQQDQPSFAPSPNVIPSSPHRSRWLFWAIGGLVVALLLCGSIVLVGGISLFQNSQSASTDAIKVVDQFMQAGVRKDAAAGFALFSPKVQNQQITQNGIATLFTTHEEYFTKYASVKQDSFGVTSGTSGVAASLEGTISYTGRPDRKFAATLAKENEQWRLIGIRLLEEVGK